MMADVSLVHVRYRGNAPALTDLIAGQARLTDLGGTPLPGSPASSVS